MATLTDAHTIQLTATLVLKRDGPTMPWYLKSTNRGVVPLDGTGSQKAVNVIAAEMAKG